MLFRVRGGRQRPLGACLDQAADLIDRDVEDHGCVGIWSGIA